MSQRSIDQAFKGLASDRPANVEKAAEQLMKLVPGDPRLEHSLKTLLTNPSKRIKIVAERALINLKAAKQKEPQAAGTITVKGTTLAGNLMEVKVCPSYNVQSLKELFGQQLGKDATSLKLLLASQILEDSMILGECCFHDGVEITVIVVSDLEQSSSAELDLHIRNLEDSSEEVQMAALSWIEKYVLQMSFSGAAFRGLFDALFSCLQRALSCEHWSVQASSKKVALKSAQLLCVMDSDAATHLLLQHVRYQLSRVQGSTVALQQRKHNRHWTNVLQGELDAEKQWFLQLANLLVPMAAGNEGVIQTIVPCILDCLRDGSDRIRKDAASILALLNVYDDAIVNALLQRLQEEKRQEIISIIVHALSKLVGVILRRLKNHRGFDTMLYRFKAAASSSYDSKSSR